MKSRRSKRRLPVRQTPATEAVSSPLTNLRPDQIASVKLGADPDEDDHILIDMTIPTEGGALASYEEQILLEDEAPAYLRDAATVFFDACARAVRERVVAKTRTCGACLGCCCYVFDRVDVSGADVQLLRNAGIAGLAGLEVSQLVEMYEDDYGRPRTTLKGHVGLLRKVPLVHPLSGETVSACPAFDGEKCTIYEHRPQACREFTMINCDQFEPHPEPDPYPEPDGQPNDGEHVEHVEPTQEGDETR